MGEALSLHDQIMRTSLTYHGGYEVTTPSRNLMSNSSPDLMSLHATLPAGLADIPILVALKS